jgi:hypothetical protein
MRIHTKFTVQTVAVFLKALYRYINIYVLYTNVNVYHIHINIHVRV